MVLGIDLGQTGVRVQFLSGDQQIVAQAGEKPSVSQSTRARPGMTGRPTPKSSECVLQPPLLFSEPVAEMANAELNRRTCLIAELP